MFPSHDPEAIDNKDCKFTNEDGFVLGWLTGDGWISWHSNNKSFQYGFVFSEEDCDNQIARRVLSYTNNLAKTPSNLRQDHDTNCYTYCTSDKNVHEQFVKLGAQNKRMGTPNTVYCGNDDFVKGYIDGLFSSDGYVEAHNRLSKCRVVLTSSHKKLINSIRKLLSFYGIKSSITKTVVDNKYCRFDLVIGGMFARKFAETFSLSNGNKQDRLNQILLADGSGYVNNREYLVVKSVEATDIYEDVYDITVHDDTHTFITELRS